MTRSIFHRSHSGLLVAGALLLGLMLTASWSDHAAAQNSEPGRTIGTEPSEPAKATPAPASTATPAPAASPATPSAPAPAAAIAPPDDPVAKAAFAVLEKHCSRCHQEGRLTARERPAKNFGFILKLDQLAADPHYVLPGNPFGSRLFKQVVDKEMPYDLYNEGAAGPEVSEADVKALEAWINALGASKVAACDANSFISDNDVVAAIAADLDKLSKPRARGTRYLSLVSLKNACTAESALKVYRQGAVKLLNSLSRASSVVRLETIDKAGTLIRFNIDDLGWQPQDWDKVLAVYPYNTQPDTSLTSLLAAATGTALPYVRADWFAFTAAQPPLYDVLLALPNNFDALAHEQRVDVSGDIARARVQRAGFQKSGVSQNNRLIERHPSRAGYFWTSYDFAGNRRKQSLFEFPLGPGGAFGFDHDGGETIFSLPNGFQGYYLNTAKGVRLDKGPTAIVRDLTRKDLTVTNGISCMGCHDQGMRKAKDDVRAAVVSGRAFPKDVRDAVDALYPTHDAMDRIIADDAKRFAEAMAAAGLDPTLKFNGVEMINALAKRYEDDVDETLAAAELGLTKPQFADAARDAAKSFRPLIRRLEQGVVPRDQFEVRFREIAADLTDQKLVAGTGTTTLVVASQPTHAVGEIAITSDRDSYRVGDTPVFTIRVPRDCYLTLTNVDEKGEGTVLFPNKFQRENRVKGGTALEFPGAGAPFRYRMKDPGVETVIAVCSEGGEDVDGIRHDFTRDAFTTVPNYSAAVARSVARPRSIAVEQASPGPQAPRPTAARPAASQRSAIKIAVR